MIFVSLGTMDMPFFRMARAIDKWAETSEEEVVVQTGYTSYEYKNVHAFRFCTKDEMRCYIEKANIVILQGGWGAISEAIEMRKRIVVMPRHNGTEHIHDQFQLVRKLDEMGCVIGVFDENELPTAIAKAGTFDFQQMEKGNAEEMIEKKLKEWWKRN